MMMKMEAFYRNIGIFSIDRGSCFLVSVYVIDSLVEELISQCDN
jgi:hypothetical protein